MLRPPSTPDTTSASTRTEPYPPWEPLFPYNNLPPIPSEHLTTRAVERLLQPRPTAALDALRATRPASSLVEELSRYLVGWRGYFGFCEVPYLRPAPPRPVDPSAASRRRLEALEACAHSLRGAAPSRRRQEVGGSDRQQRPRPMADQPQPGTQHRAVQRLFRPDWPRIRRRRPCRLTPSNRRVRTRTHGGVGGAEPRGPPQSVTQIQPYPGPSRPAITSACAQKTTSAFSMTSPVAPSMALITLCVTVGRAHRNSPVARSRV